MIGEREPQRLGFPDHPYLQNQFTTKILPVDLTIDPGNTL